MVQRERCGLCSSAVQHVIRRHLQKRQREQIEILKAAAGRCGLPQPAAYTSARMTQLKLQDRIDANQRYFVFRLPIVSSLGNGGVDKT